ERRKDLVAIVLTHAHEDHLGAVPFLWPRLECPVYATGFAASVLRRKLADVGLAGRVPIHEYVPGQRLALPPFDVEPIYITHSIPEPMALAIRTPAGTVLHTGDWKLDADPVLGPKTDEAGLRRVGDGGVLALVGDSTNALVPGESGSEEEVYRNLVRTIGECRQRVAVACFASNVGRLQSIARAAAANDRNVGLVGRSLWRMTEAARENGYLADLPPFLDESDSAFVPRDKILLICTGSQGEPRSALARIAADQHPHIALEAEDTVIFSSRTIPGNERAILTLQNGLAAQGVTVITAEDRGPGEGGPIHVSGHPCQDELARMYQIVRPRIAIPVHGEARHMRAHAELARSCQVPHGVVPENGAVVELDPDNPRIVDHVHAGRLALDGERLVPMDGLVVKARGRMLFNGAALATVVVDRRGRLIGAPQVSAPGLIDPDADAEMLEDVVDAVATAVERAKGDDDQLRAAALQALKRALKAATGKRPTADVHLVRV
ncbi:MAG: ribonuclease J, partial [Alphaproteobacteria bacterium]|nr:ribonuclease J [Alphaproteobacteria bacterium]